MRVTNYGGLLWGVVSSPGAPRLTAYLLSFEVVAHAYDRGNIRADRPVWVIEGRSGTVKIAPAHRPYLGAISNEGTYLCVLRSVMVEP